MIFDIYPLLLKKLEDASSIVSKVFKIMF